MTHYIKLTLLLLFTCSITFLRAQVFQATETDTASYPYWIEMMQDQEANFFATQKAFNTYWNGREVTKGSGFKPFKRWEYFTGLRVKPDGTKPEADRNLKAYKTYMMQHAGRSVNGDWTPLGPFTVPSGYNGYRGLGRINAVAFHPTDPDILYIGAPAGGLWISEDHGLTWNNHTDILPTLGVSAIVIDYINTGVIYMGTGDRDAGDASGLGVWKSFDGGITWSVYNTGMGNTTVSKLIMHPQYPNMIFAATGSGIYKTSDGGITWDKKANGTFKDIVFKPGNPDIIYATLNGTFYKSSDGGETFAMGANGLPAGARGAIAVSPANPEIVYVFLTNSDSFKGLYRSIDSGVSFEERSTSPNIMSWDCSGGSGGQAWYDLDVAADPTNPDILYGGGVNCFKSTDGGSTWNIRSHWYGGCGVQSVHADLHVLEYSPLTGKLFAGNDGGVYWTENGGLNWTEISNGLVISQAYKIGQSATNRNFVINGYQDNGTSSWTGTEWIAVGGGDGMECAYDPTDDRYSYSTVYYGSMNRNYNHSGQGQIAGQGVNGITESGAWVTPFLIDHNDGNIMFIGYKNIWRSTNLKANNTSSVDWTKISDISTSDMSVMAQSRANTGILYAASGNKLYRSDNVKDVSVSWLTLTGNLPSGNNITAIETSHTDENVVFVVQQNRVFRSADKGNSWIDLTGTLPDVQMSTLANYRHSPEGLYLGTDIGIFYRDYNMADWILFSNGFPASARVTELEIFYDPAGQQGDVIRAGTYGRGLWESPMHFSTPTAEFDANRTIVPIGCPVDFSDLSSGIPYEWNWSFEGAETTTSTLQNPAGIVWNTPGEYSVSLEAANPAGTDTETKAGFIVVSDTLLPLTAFTSDERIFCSGPALVKFTDQTDFCPSDWLWEFSPETVTFTNGTSASSQNPEVIFNDSEKYNVTLTASNTNGSRSLTRENYIMFGGLPLPFNENWESATLTANRWELVNPDNKKSWEISPVSGNSPGNTAIRMDYYGYNVAPGPKDQLISPPLNLKGYNSAFLSFGHAYCRRYEQITDSLIIQVSEDCGSTWTRVSAFGEDGTGIFETHPVSSTTAFIPETVDDWCGAAGTPACFMIDLSAWAGKSNIKVMFESIHRRGNGLYIDNISISDLVAIAQPATIADGFRVYPNPNHGSFVVETENNLNTGILRLYSIDGMMVYESTLAAGNKWVFNKPGIPAGLYILHLIHGDKTFRTKLVIE
ncbi:MAG: PKD domain-containing protein [Bacteroidota bacterium]